MISKTLYIFGLVYIFNSCSHGIKFTGNIPKKRDVKALRIALNAAKDWIKEIPDGDSLVFRAEGAKADQLFRIYKKWFATHEDIPWVISEKHKSFFFYKKRL